MPHPTHNMNAYRDNGFEWVAYCEKCSVESDGDLEKECPGEYIRKVDKVVDKSVDKELKTD